MKKELLLIVVIAMLSRSCGNVVKPKSQAEKYDHMPISVEHLVDKSLDICTIGDENIIFVDFAPYGPDRLDWISMEGEPVSTMSRQDCELIETIFARHGM
jgi:hypothetical protein